MVWWLIPRVCQTVTKELDFIFLKLLKIKKYKEIIIWKNFERNFARNCVKNGFFLQNISVENSLICPKNKSASHCPTELFPIYPNNHWTIRRRYDHIVVPSSNRIKLKIDWFSEYCQIINLRFCFIKKDYRRTLLEKLWYWLKDGSGKVKFGQNASSKR